MFEVMKEMVFKLSFEGEWELVSVRKEEKVFWLKEMVLFKSRFSFLYYIFIYFCNKYFYSIC